MRYRGISNRSIFISFLAWAGFVSSPIAGAACPTSTDFQNDADIVRLNHLKYYISLVEEYQQETGQYPYMDEASMPVYVHLASPEQEEYAKGGPPYSHKRKTVKEFVTLLETALGREINEYYDPQKVPVCKPNFYIYMAKRGSYFLAVHISQPYPFARQIGDGYYKVEVSNAPTPENMASGASELLGSDEFILAINEPISKPGFFEDRVSETLRATK